MPKNAWKIVFLFLFALSSFTVNRLLVREISRTHNISKSAEEQVYYVSKVIDGDTIQLSTDEIVRLVGIDAPEIYIIENPGETECFAIEAKMKTQELVLGKEVRLEKDIKDKDAYGRLLRYVWVDGLLLNKVLVEQGYARAVAFAPDVKFQSELNDAQQIAREQKSGLWGSCID